VVERLTPVSPKQTPGEPPRVLGVPLLDPVPPADPPPAAFGGSGLTFNIDGGELYERPWSAPEQPRRAPVDNCDTPVP